MTALDLQDHPHVDVQEPSTETAPASAPLSEEEAFLQAVRGYLNRFDEVYLTRDDMGFRHIYVIVGEDTDEVYALAIQSEIRLRDRFPRLCPTVHVWVHQNDTHRDFLPSDRRRVLPGE